MGFRGTLGFREAFRNQKKKFKKEKKVMKLFHQQGFRVE